MKSKHIITLVALTVLLAGCDYSNSENKSGLFYNLFVKPIDNLLHWLGSNLHHDYGLAIIIIVVLIRTIMLPFMLAQTKNGHMMRKTMEIAKPEIEKIQEKVKRSRTQEEKMEANQKMMEVYKKYDINPVKNALGCLPILIQMPILFGLYVSLKWPSTGGLLTHPNFLWFNLMHPDLLITIIAGTLYFFQSFVNIGNMPKEQRQIGYIMMIISPVFIIYISISSPSALGLYWSISALYLIIQTYFSNKYFSKIADIKVSKINQKLNASKNTQTKNTQTIKKSKK